MQASGCLSGIPTGFKSLDEVITGLKEKGDFRKDQANEICEYFNCKLGGSKIPAERRIDIERSLRVKDAVDVLDTLEDAYYNKVKFIDGIVPPASYAAFIDAIPRYLSTSHQCDLNKQLRIIREGCSVRLPGYDSIECYRYLLEYKMALESVKYTESEIMKCLILLTDCPKSLIFARQNDWYE